MLIQAFFGFILGVLISCAVNDIGLRVTIKPRGIKITTKTGYYVFRWISEGGKFGFSFEKW